MQRLDPTNTARWDGYAKGAPGPDFTTQLRGNGTSEKCADGLACISGVCGPFWLKIAQMAAHRPF